MPTVFRKSGFNIKINIDDHRPMHVHVWHQGHEIIIEFEDEVITRDNYGFNRNEERRALLIVGDNQIFLQNRWRQIHG